MVSTTGRMTVFTRDGENILTFRVYDGYGNCINEFTGTMKEWQDQIAAAIRENGTLVKSAGSKIGLIH